MEKTLSNGCFSNQDHSPFLYAVCSFYPKSSLPQRQEVARNKYAFHVATLCTHTYTCSYSWLLSNTGLNCTGPLTRGFSVNTVSAFPSYRSLNELTVGKVCIGLEITTCGIRRIAV